MNDINKKFYKDNSKNNLYSFIFVAVVLFLWAFYDYLTLEFFLNFLP